MRTVSTGRQSMCEEERAHPYHDEYIIMLGPSTLILLAKSLNVTLLVMGVAEVCGHPYS